MPKNAGKIEKLFDPIKPQRVAVDHAEPGIESLGHNHRETLSGLDRIDRITRLDIRVHTVPTVRRIFNAPQ